MRKSMTLEKTTLDLLKSPKGNVKELPFATPKADENFTPTYRKGDIWEVCDKTNELVYDNDVINGSWRVAVVQKDEVENSIEVEVLYLEFPDQKQMIASNKMTDLKPIGSKTYLTRLVMVDNEEAEVLSYDSVIKQYFLRFNDRDTGKLSLRELNDDDRGKIILNKIPLLSPALKAAQESINTWWYGGNLVNLRRDYFKNSSPEDIIGALIMLPLDDKITYVKGVVIGYDKTKKKYEVKFYSVLKEDEVVTWNSVVFNKSGHREYVDLEMIEKSIVITNFNQNLKGRYIAILDERLKWTKYMIVGFENKYNKHYLLKIDDSNEEKAAAADLKVYKENEITSGNQVFWFDLTSEEKNSCLKSSFDLNNPHLQDKYTLFAKPVNEEDEIMRDRLFSRIQIYSLFGLDYASIYHYPEDEKTRKPIYKQVEVLYEKGEMRVLNLRNVNLSWTFADSGNNELGKPISKGIVSFSELSPTIKNGMSNMSAAILLLSAAESFNQIFTKPKDNPHVLKRDWYENIAHLFKTIWSGDFAVVGLSSIYGMLMAIIGKDTLESYGVKKKEFYKASPITLAIMILDAIPVQNSYPSISEDFFKSSICYTEKCKICEGSENLSKFMDVKAKRTASNLEKIRLEDFLSVPCIYRGFEPGLKDCIAEYFKNKPNKTQEYVCKSPSCAGKSVDTFTEKYIDKFPDYMFLEIVRENESSDRVAVPLDETIDLSAFDSDTSKNKDKPKEGKAPKNYFIIGVVIQPHADANPDEYHLLSKHTDEKWYLNKGKKSILVSASSDEAKRKIPNFDLNCKYFLLQREKK